jgi:hypothetical protein
MYTLPPKARFSSSVGNGLFNSASLDLPFAKTKSLVDATTGAQLVDFTRASSGTYVDSEGVIRTATTNLLLRSEELGAAPWTANSGGSGTTITDDYGIAPNGNATADLVTFNIKNGSREQAFTSLDGVTYTLSFYAKRISGNYDLQFLHFNSATSVSTNLTVTDSWERYSVSFLGKFGGGTVIVGIRDNNDSGWGGVLVWGAQLEQSTTVGEYIPTTSTINSAPRFDHNPTTGESLGLLVEEQRTNVIVNNQTFTSSTGATATNNAVTSPLGTTTAATIVEDGTTGNHATSSYAFTVTAVASTFSFFAKANGRNWIALRFQGVTRAWFDISTGAIGTVDGSTTASITPYGNGFYRCVATLTPIAGAANVFWRMGSANGTDSYAGDSTSGVILFGAQAETGSFPTSYIPTTDAAATRAADVASISGSNFSSWYRQDEGTMFAEFNRPAAVTGLRSIAAVSDGGFNNRMTFRTDSAVLITSFVITGGVNNATFPSAINSGANNKAALAYATNDFNAGVNGVSGTNDTVGTAPVVDRLSIGAVLTAERSCSYIRRLTYWPTRLGNEVLQTITQ